MDSAMGTLCRYCKVLEIDDAAWGGFRDESTPGKNFLAFSGGKTHEICLDSFVGKDILKKYPDTRASARFRYFTCHYGRQDTFPELPDLKESAAECGFCALLRDWIRWHAHSLRRFGDPEQPVIIRSLLYQWYEAIGKNNVPFRILEYLWIKASLGDLGDVEGGHTLGGGYLTTYAPDGPCATWLGIPEEPPKLPDLWEKISIIKSSLLKCAEECGHSKFSDFVPSRLIHVGDKTEFGFGDPRLVVLSDPEHLPEGCMNDNIEYAVLSYCWGESTRSALTTTMGNLATHLKKIPLAKMPATCRDAILVTRALGLKWLWIDAFCIIQENNADWHNEAAKMAGVYGNAFVTIIPLRSLSSHDGFLDQLKKPAEVRVPFKSSINPIVKGYYTIRASSKEKDLHHTLETELCSSKWQTRGWTYQENTMSLRKLYFGEMDIYFKCSSRRTITCKSSVPQSRGLRGEFWPLAEVEEKHGGLYPGSESRIWYESINDFCRRDLTFKTDIFPAISAVAKMHCVGDQENYQCGLRRSDFHNGVLWKTMDGKLSREEHMEKLMSRNDYVAPSWSWASAYAMGYSVHYDDRNRHFKRPSSKVLEVESLLVDSSNPFGCVLSGHLLVRGKWCALSNLRFDYVVKSRIYPNHELCEGNESIGVCEFDWAVSKHTELDGSDVLPASYTKRLVILWVAKCRRFGMAQGLLLIPSVGNETWYRVGTFRTYYRECGLQISEERVFKIV